MLGPHPSMKGPVNKHTPHLLGALRRQGWAVDYLPWSRREGQDSAAERALYRFADALRVVGRLLSTSYDCVYVKSAHTTAGLARDLPMLVLLKLLGRCVVLQLHGSDSAALAGQGHAVLTQTSRLEAACADALLLLSTQEIDEWQSICPVGKLHLVANAFVPSAEAATMAETTRDRPGCPPRLLFVGRLLREKGIFDLLVAVGRLRASRQVTLDIVGDGPERGALQRAVIEAGLSGSVTVAGYVEGTALYRAYADADLFVLPTYYDEGFPTVLTEAMFFGLPVVTTPLRGARDHLADGVNAVFVQPRDPRALAKAIESLLDDPGLMQRMREANRQKPAEFAPDVVAQRYSAIMAAAIARRRGRR